MPYVVTCPECSTRLKSPAVVLAGKAITCPQCKHAFTTTADSPELSDAPSAPSTTRPPLPPAAPKVKGEEVLQDATFVDDEPEDKPKAKKRRDDEDDDRPRSKKRRDDDHEDDRPRSKKRRDDEEDEEDDRPRSKKRRDEEDDEDDLPASRKKSGKKKKKSPLVLMLAIGLPVLFLLCGGALTGAYFLFFSGGASSDMLAWAPSGSDNISGVKYSTVSGYPSLKRNFQPRISRLENIGMSLNDVDEVMIARGGGQESIVVRSKVTLDGPKMMKSANATEANASGKTYYKAPAGSFYLASSKLLVYCPSDNTMTELLRKDAKVTISNDMKTLVGKAGGDIWEAKMSAGGGIGFGGFSAPKSEYGSGRIIGNQLKLSQTLVFNDDTAAKNAESQMRAFAQLFKSGPKGKKFESFDVSQSGSTVTVTATGNIEEDSTFIFGGF